MNSPTTDAAFLSDQKFWDIFLPLFLDDKKVREFSEVSGIPEDHIKIKRREFMHVYLIKLSPHLHRGNNTVN